MILRRLILSGIILFVGTSAFAQDARPSVTAPATARAQEPGQTNRTRLMLGIDFKETLPVGEGLASRAGVGFMWRWRSRTPRLDDRFAFAYRLGSYSTQVSSDVLGRETEIGDLHLRPLMVGVDYKMPRGKWTWSLGATAGWSLNKLDTAPAFRHQLTDHTNEDVVTDVHNSFAWSPRFKGWYDVNRRVSFMVESTYNFSRPDVTIRSGGVDLSRRLNADAFIFKAGIVYGIW